MADLLDMAYINSLPQPFLARTWGSSEAYYWPVEDIDVQTGLLRFDVCGKLEVKHIGDIKDFKDITGKVHDPDDFYIDAERQQPQ